MGILVLVTSSFVERQRAAIATLAPEERIHTDPAAAPPDDIDALLAYKLEPGIVPRFPALKFIACAGAGADDILAASDVPPHIPIVRIVDPVQGQRMSQYVAMTVLRIHRDLARLEAQHRAAEWHRFVAPPEDEWPIGVMGGGSIGMPVIEILSRLGYPVAVWTRTARTMEGVETFAGPARLASFLARSRIVICTLPLTGETRGLLNAGTFAALPRGAYVVNVSRGAVLREADLAAAIAREHLAGAALDVFETEPLPASSPLWRHPKILCTPHIAGPPSTRVAAQQFLDNLQRARTGLPLANVVDRARGY